MNKEYPLKKVLLFLIFFAISINLCYFYRLNQSSKSLEDSFFRLSQNQKFLSAYLLNVQELKPIQKAEENLPEITAKSVVSLLIKNDNSEMILYERNKDQKLPIASLTKLMTAKIVFENYNLNEIIKIQKEAVNQIGKAGNYKIGDNFKVGDLLYSTLMESSNDAAWALAETTGIDKFVGLMNSETKKIGLSKTFFVNPTGLSSTTSTSVLGENYSTAADLAKFGEYLIKNDSKILEISSLKEFDLNTTNGILHHKILNKNELLNENENFKIIGGKTGYTKKAKNCLFLIIKAPKNQGVIINVILGSKYRFEERFKEMRELIDWLKTAYIW